jgi:hypothetical protein
MAEAVPLAEEAPPFWLNDDGLFWISAERFPDARKAGEALMDEASYSMSDDDSLVCEGRKTVWLRDCPLDDCEGHHDEATGRDLDCPEFLRDVWEFTSSEKWGDAWDDLEAAIAKGRVVILHPDLVERGGEVHWRDDCECARCDVAPPVPDHEAPSVPMFGEFGA